MSVTLLKYACSKFILVTILSFVLHFTHGDLSSGKETGRFLPSISPFQIVTFPNDPCTGTSTELTGTCYSSGDCSKVDGSYADGSCAQGFGVCCIIRISGCGITLNVNDNSTHIQNTDYPSALTETSTCQYSLNKLNKDICFFRLDFIHFVIDGTNSNDKYRCVDKLEFTGAVSNNPPYVCGYNTGQHLYIDASDGAITTNPSLQFTFSGSFSRYWNIRVDQIFCGMTHTPPKGCDQYFMESSGNFKSFNFGITTDGHHLNDQDITVCIRRDKEHCKIAYYPSTTEDESFYLSRRPKETNPTRRRASAGIDGCGGDYVIIPDATTSLTGVASCQSDTSTLPSSNSMDRFCGQRLNCMDDASSSSVMYSDVVPFMVQIIFSETDSTKASKITPGVELDNKNRGLSLNYRQIRC